MSTTQPVNNHQEDTTERGGTWVVAQFALMIAGLTAGPIWRAQWNGRPAFAAGIVLLLLGAWLGLRGKRDLGLNRTPFPQPKEDARLITTGIYARLRHSRYAMAQILFFDAKARHEERRLRELFPDYAAYARRVKRFIPGLY